MTASEKRHLSRVASLPCLICGAKPVHIHHVRRYGETRKHDQVVPLCLNHHMGAEGIHTLGKKLWELRYMTQDQMLTITAERLK